MMLLSRPADGPMMARFRLAPVVWFAALCCRRRGEMLYLAMSCRAISGKVPPHAGKVPPHADSRRSRLAPVQAEAEAETEAVRHMRRIGARRVTVLRYTWEP